MRSYLAELPGTYSRTPTSRCRRRASVIERGLTLRAGLRPNRCGMCFAQSSSSTCEGRAENPSLSGIFDFRQTEIASFLELITKL